MLSTECQKKSLEVEENILYILYFFQITIILKFRNSIKRCLEVEEKMLSILFETVTEILFKYKYTLFPEFQTPGGPST